MKVSSEKSSNEKSPDSPSPLLVGPQGAAISN